MKNYVFGDTGGHAQQLWDSLEEIGVDLAKAYIPEGVRIIHLGDLIHKGPASRELLKVVDRIIRNNPEQWVQILGNHEFQHVEGSPYFWRCDCNFEDIDVINYWFDEGLAKASFGLDSHSIASLEPSGKDKIGIPDIPVLFSHAGLTRVWWDALEQPVSAVEAARLINMLPPEIVTTAGELLGVRCNAGPVWAVGNSEVFDSWNVEGKNMPFIQFHGHTSSYVWKAGKWWRNDSGFKNFREATKLNPESRAVITKTAGSLIVGVDPGYSVKADTVKQPYVMFESLD